jgi:hypothetical protein
MSADVRAFYADIGIDLPDRGGENVPVRCFADPGSHRHEDRNVSTSVSVESGLFHCHTCGAAGGPYHAALAVGRSPAEAMQLLERHNLKEEDSRRPAPSRNGSRPKPSEADLERYRTALGSSALERLRDLRGWSPSVVRRLGLGLDGERIVFPVRDRAGQLVGLVRYSPNPARRAGPKSKADPGSKRDLVPSPENVAGDELWVVEGEPDAVAAHTLGLPGIAVPGVHGWDSAWAERFAGRRVVIALDCDAPGRGAAKRIASDLAEQAAGVRVLDLDPSRDDGHDFGDLLLEAAEHGADGLLDLRRTLERMATAAEVDESISTAPPGDGAELLDAVAAFLRRFVVMSPAQAAVASLWVLHTYTLDSAEATPYLSITSAEKRSGKTRALEVFELLVARPWLTGRVTAAVLARKVDAERPTLLLDESDAAFKGEKEYAEALRGLLNTGHRPGGKSSICVGQGSGLTYQDFSTFSAKAIAGIGALPDTVADRSLPIRLERKAPGEKAERFRRREVEPEAAVLRDRLEGFAAAAIDALTVARPALPEQLDDRGQDAAEPLLAIADLAGGEWAEGARRAIVEVRGGAALEDDSVGVRLLGDVREVFEGRERLSTAELIAALNALEESPWGDWYGKPLTSRALGKLLRPYAVRSRTVRLPDGSTAKGFVREQFEDSWRRYLPTTPPLSDTPSQPALGAGLSPIRFRHKTPLCRMAQRPQTRMGSGL